MDEDPAGRLCNAHYDLGEVQIQAGPRRFLVLQHAPATQARSRGVCHDSLEHRSHASAEARRPRRRECAHGHRWRHESLCLGRCRRQLREHAHRSRLREDLPGTGEPRLQWAGQDLCIAPLEVFQRRRPRHGEQRPHCHRRGAHAEGMICGRLACCTVSHRDCELPSAGPLAKPLAAATPLQSTASSRGESRVAERGQQHLARRSALSWSADASPACKARRGSLHGVRRIVLASAGLPSFG
mmetsp:Transcript_21042/g.57504  ORF Transcript_21042/g.57504 Transcript_21042/m.57504 type:complete len:241 (-) Transcript_21042:40-762(-)